MVLQEKSCVQRSGWVLPTTYSRIETLAREKLEKIKDPVPISTVEDQQSTDQL
jgi:hypothetical protein